MVRTPLKWLHYGIVHRNCYWELIDTILRWMFGVLGVSLLKWQPVCRCSPVAVILISSSRYSNAVVRPRPKCGHKWYVYHITMPNSLNGRSVLLRTFAVNDNWEGLREWIFSISCCSMIPTAAFRVRLPYNMPISCKNNNIVKTAMFFSWLHKFI